MKTSARTAGPPTSTARVIHLDDSVPVTDLAWQLGIKPSQVVAGLLEFGCYVDNLGTTISFSDAARIASLHHVTAKCSSTRKTSSLTPIPSP